MRNGWICSILVMLISSSSALAVTGGEFLQSDIGMKLIRENFKLNRKVKPKEASTTILSESDRYSYQQLDLKFEAIGRARIWLRMPRNPKGPVPLVYVLGGVQSSSDILKLFPERGDQIIAVYDFGGQKYDKVYQIAGEVGKQIPQLQGRMAAALAYMAGNVNVDPNKVSVIMVSFGSFVGPLAIRLAEPLLPAPINSTVFAFGGGSLAKLILPKLKTALSEEDYKNVSRELSNVIDLLEPKHHLATMKGRFLIINGENDRLISEESAKVIEDGLNGPKTVITLPVGHINRDQLQIVEKTMAEVEVWMTENGAL